jgi:phosphoglycolate phosphatase
MRHWVFDFDGTLIDTDGLFTKALEYTLQPFSVTVGPEFLEQVRHKHPYRIFEDLLSQEQADRAMQRLREINQELNDEAQPYEGIEDVLNTLEKKKVSVSIWTGRDRESTVSILQKTNLHDYFSKILSGTCVEVNKPGLDGLLELKDHHEAEPDEMIMIGDHHHDIEPANHLGLTSVHAQWKRIPHQLPGALAPHYTFTSVEEFHEWILEQLKHES